MHWVLTLVPKRNKFRECNAFKMRNIKQLRNFFKHQNAYAIDNCIISSNLAVFTLVRPQTTGNLTPHFLNRVVRAIVIQKASISGPEPAMNLKKSTERMNALYCFFLLSQKINLLF